MMERMGWSEGKGLGAKESGQTTHVKIKSKRDALGVGASKDHDYAWLATQDIFSQVLAGLNESVANGTVLEEKEDKSQTVTQAIQTRRAAMFYGRFKRSKDTSNYTSEDLACILGGKEKRPQRLKSADEEAEKEAKEAKKREEDGEVSHQSGVVTITRTESIQDYFARLSAAKKAGVKASVASTPVDAVSSSLIADKSEDQKASEDEEEVRKKKKSKKEKKKEEAVEEAEPSAEDKEEKKAKKKEKKSKELREAAVEAEAAEDDGKKKKKKKSRDDDEQAAPLEEKEEKKRSKRSNSDDEESGEKDSKKKKSKKGNDDEAGAGGEESSGKKKKKKSKSEKE